MMENIILMKDSAIKSGIFTKSLRKIMTETKEKARVVIIKSGKVNMRARKFSGIKRCIP